MADFPLGEISFHVPTREAMHELGTRLCTLLKPADILTLQGTLGAGKTTFVQGLAWALGLPKNQYAQSPTYPVALTYPTTPTLHHLDLYRVAMGASELLGDAYFSDESITVIEWAELAPDFVPPQGFNLTFTIDNATEHRVVGIKPRDTAAHLRLVDWLTESALHGT